MSQSMPEVAPVPDWWKDTLHLGESLHFASPLMGLSPPPANAIGGIIRKMAALHPLPRTGIQSLARDNGWHTLCVPPGSQVPRRWEGCNVAEVALRQDVALPQWRWLLRAGFDPSYYNPQISFTLLGFAVRHMMVGHVREVLKLGLMSPLVIERHHLDQDSGPTSLVGTNILDRTLMYTNNNADPKRLELIRLLLWEAGMMPSENLPSGGPPRMVDRLSCHAALDLVNERQSFLDQANLRQGTASRPRPKARPRL